MGNIVTSTRFDQPYRVLALISLALILLVGFFVYNTWVDNRVFYRSEKPFITHEYFENKYGLQVKLIEVTADGGFVECYLKIIDSQKARLLLDNSKLMPGLWVEKTDTHLMTAEEIMQDFKLEEGGVIVITLPNLNGVVRPGTPVNIVFGNIFVEPYLVQ